MPDLLGSLLTFTLLRTCPSAPNLSLSICSCSCRCCCWCWCCGRVSPALKYISPSLLCCLSHRERETHHHHPPSLTRVLPKRSVSSTAMVGAERGKKPSEPSQQFFFDNSSSPLSLSIPFLHKPKEKKRPCRSSVSHHHQLALSLILLLYYLCLPPGDQTHHRRKNLFTTLRYISLVPLLLDFEEVALSVAGFCVSHLLWWCATIERVTYRRRWWCCSEGQQGRDRRTVSERLRERE